ncbi:hypothetical protein ACFQ7A_06955 [Streptomyces sp. NPDC056528]
MTIDRRRRTPGAVAAVTTADRDRPAPLDGTAGTGTGSQNLTFH